MAAAPHPDVPVQVRPYKAPDGADTLRIFQAAVHEVASRDYTREQVSAWAPDTIDSEEWGRRRLAARTYVATLAGRVVGFSDFTADGVLDMLFVDPAAGGRGVARALLEHVMREAALAGHVRLDTHASITARPVFERRGFTVDAPRRNDVRGQVLWNFDMHVVLPRPAAPGGG